ncbi:hypothetical protein HZH66_011901 [Vespula vulgaris]|uniref:Uncharacterized protein n=1 Tax=Vespula vulgaris TaxID=7454 RepID=A0A834MWC1_VESVU|nr:hypothetical protein HZH66_011901 [Vespula vulgaris]
MVLVVVIVNSDDDDITTTTINSSSSSSSGSSSSSSDGGGGGGGNSNNLIIRLARVTGLPESTREGHDECSRGPRSNLYSPIVGLPIESFCHRGILRDHKSMF